MGVRKKVPTKRLVEAAIRGGARPLTEEEYRAEEGVTSLVFSPRRRRRKLPRFWRKR